MSTSTETPPSAPRVLLDRLLAFLATPRGITLLLTLWPALLGALGLPTGAAEKALHTYREVMGQSQCADCPPCPEAATEAPPPPAENAE